jgi:hypothetical protein
LRALSIAALTMGEVLERDLLRPKHMKHILRW